jgi:HK97 family phage portal protein
VSVLRRALGRTEQRLSPQALIEAMPDGYGQPGYGWWGDGMVWNPAAGPSAVTPDQAMRLSAVFGCLRLLSEAISTLPLQTFTRQGGVRKPFYPVPSWLQFQPPQGSRIVYLSQVMLSLLTDGNAYVAIVRNQLKEPTELVVLDPALVTVLREKGRILYEVVGFKERLGPLDVMHIVGMTMPGALEGLSPIGYAREVIDAGRQAQTMGANIMRNHGVPPAVIEVPADAQGGTSESTQEKARKIARLFQETNGGSSAGKVAALTGGATLKTVAFKPEDLQWLDSKRFGVSEIARFFGVPPHLIADASNSTSWGSGLAEQNLAFGQFSLRPWTERIEDAHSRLLTDQGLGDVFVKLNLDALLRASLQDRYESYSVGISSKFLLPNEARKLEDLPPLPDGDSFPAAPAPPVPPAPDEEPVPAPGGAQ